MYTWSVVTNATEAFTITSKVYVQNVSEWSFCEYMIFKF